MSESTTVDTAQGQEAHPVDWQAKYEAERAHSKKWEDRAKENAAAAKELEALRNASMTSEERAAKAEAELAALRAEIESSKAVAAAAEKYGVPASVLRGSTPDEVEAHAKALAEVMGKQPAAPLVRTDGKKPTNPAGGERQATAEFAAALFGKS